MKTSFKTACYSSRQLDRYSYRVLQARSVSTAPTARAGCVNGVVRVWPFFAGGKAVEGPASNAAGQRASMRILVAISVIILLQITLVCSHLQRLEEDPVSQENDDVLPVPILGDLPITTRITLEPPSGHGAAVEAMITIEEVTPERVEAPSSIEEIRASTGSDNSDSNSNSTGSGIKSVGEARLTETSPLIGEEEAAASSTSGNGIINSISGGIESEDIESEDIESEDIESEEGSRPAESDWIHLCPAENLSADSSITQQMERISAETE
jgi:hypothetical protein